MIGDFSASSASQLFLDGARVVLEAVGDERVGERWPHPSVLEDQSIGGLAGHPARGGVWVVAEYLEAGTSKRPVDLSSAVDYFAAVVSNADETTHRAVRARSATIAQRGQHAVVDNLRTRLGELQETLAGIDTESTIAVFGGMVMPLAEYLKTRVVEQCVAPRRPGAQRRPRSLATARSPRRPHD